MLNFACQLFLLRERIVRVYIYIYTLLGINECIPVKYEILFPVCGYNATKLTT
jgi:hypothetical protein